MSKVAAKLKWKSKWLVGVMVFAMVVAAGMPAVPVANAVTPGAPGVPGAPGQPGVPVVGSEFEVSTFAGYVLTDESVADDTLAKFNRPTAIVMDSVGNLFVADYENHKIRKITPDGKVSTFAGSTEGQKDGTGTAAQLSTPTSIVVDSADNLYIFEKHNQAIRKITKNAVVSTVYESDFEYYDVFTEKIVRSQYMYGMTRDQQGNFYLSDLSHHCIYKVTPDGVRTKYAGRDVGTGFGSGGFRDGDALTVAEFKVPFGLTMDKDGTLYVTDNWNSAIRKVTADGKVVTVAGFTGEEGFSDGTGRAVKFNNLEQIAIDQAGNLYVTDLGNKKIRKITPDGVVSTLASDIRGPVGIILGNDNNLYVTQIINSRILKITLDGNVSVVAGAGEGNVDGDARPFQAPMATVVDQQGNTYVADATKHRIRKITPAGVITVFAGNGQAGFKDGNGTQASFNAPSGLTIDEQDNLYVADTYNNRVRKISPAGDVTTLAGNGQSGLADGTGVANTKLSFPSGVAIDTQGTLYIADSGNNRIRSLATDGTLSTLAGSGFMPGFLDGPGNEAAFSFPTGITLDNQGNLIVADKFNNAIRKVTPAGQVSTIAGMPEIDYVDGPAGEARFFQPTSVAVDDSNNIYVADTNNNTIRLITPDGQVRTIAGSTTPGLKDGASDQARFNSPAGIYINSKQQIIITDTGNQLIRIMKPPVVSVTGISLSETNITLNPGDTNDIFATIQPNNATDPSVTWTSSNTQIATVDSGRITAVANGKAIITAKTTDGAYTATVTVNVKTPLDDLTLNKTELDLNPGNTFTLIANLYPATASDNQITWTSDNRAIATVDASTGLVTAIANGSTTITATSAEEGFQATAIVTVTTPVSSVTLDKTTAILKISDILNLKATINPGTASNKQITWTSSNPNIATVDATGKVKAKAIGSTIITVTTTNGKRTATTSIKVVNPVKAVTLNKTLLYLNPTETYKLVPTINPSNATIKSVKWTSSNTKVATVDANGTVTAITAGTANIVVKTDEGGFTSTAKINVSTPVTKVDIDKSTLTLKINQKASLKATVSPANATDKAITWSTSNSKIVTVDKLGNLKVLKTGTATITAISANGKQKDTCKITVK